MSGHILEGDPPQVFAPKAARSIRIEEEDLAVRRPRRTAIVAWPIHHRTGPTLTSFPHLPSAPRVVT